MSSASCGSVLASANDRSRAGLDVVPLVADQRYRIAFPRDGAMTVVALVDSAGRVLARASVPHAAWTAELALAGARWRSAVVTAP